MREEMSYGFAGNAGEYGAELQQMRLRTAWAGKPLLFFEKLDSTNIRAKYEAERGAPHGTLVVADMQTQGRGRRGRSWESPGGTNLYFTLVLRPAFSPDKASMLTLVMAYAVFRGLVKTLREGGFTAQPGIKWPNDLVIGGRKICGILTEMGMEKNEMQYVVIGCGINAGAQSFAPELADKATSLEKELGARVSRTKLAANIMEAFEEEYESFEQTENVSAFRQAYQQALVNLNREVCVLEPGGEYRGTARGINDRGELLVEMPDGSVREVFAGEVSVRGVYGYV